MSRIITVAALLVAAFATPAAAADSPADDTAEARVDDTLGLSVGLEMWGHSILGMGVVVEFAFTDTLRLTTGANAGWAGTAFPVGLGVTPLGDDGWTPVLEGGLTIHRSSGGCGGECGEPETGATAFASFGAAWFGDNWWVRGQGVVHLSLASFGDYVIMPGFAVGYAF